MSQKIVINISGRPGTGKTSIASLILGELEAYGFNVSLSDRSRADLSSFRETAIQSILKSEIHIEIDEADD